MEIRLSEQVVLILVDVAFFPRQVLLCMKLQDSPLLLNFMIHLNLSRVTLLCSKYTLRRQSSSTTKPKYNINSAYDPINFSLTKYRYVLLSERPVDCSRDKKEFVIANEFSAVCFKTSDKSRQISGLSSISETNQQALAPLFVQHPFANTYQHLYNGHPKSHNNRYKGYHLLVSEIMCEIKSSTEEEKNLSHEDKTQKT